MAVAFETKFEMVCDILDRHERKPHNLVAILQEIQEAYSYLPEDVMAYVATAIGIPPSEVFGVATFYAHFTLEPKGKYIIKVCDGTACHVKKSGDIIKAIEKKLGLTAPQITSDDLMFTLEVVACIGACGLAPVIMINEDVHGGVNVERTLELIDAVREEEAKNA